MAKIKKNLRDEYIVVHHVRGEEDVIDFLRNTSRLILDRLCFEAKNHGLAEFRFRDVNYTMKYMEDSSFLIEVKPDDITQVQ